MPPTSRAIIARSMMVSALVMAGLAYMFWQEQRAVALALIAVAIVDGLMALWFRRSST